MFLFFFTKIEIKVTSQLKILKKLNQNAHLTEDTGTHPDSKPNQSAFTPQDAVCLAEKQQISIL